jgi:hypothetical protein
MMPLPASRVRTLFVDCEPRARRTAKNQNDRRIRVEGRVMPPVVTAQRPLSTPIERDRICHCRAGPQVRAGRPGPPAEEGDESAVWSRDRARARSDVTQRVLSCVKL